MVHVTLHVLSGSAFEIDMKARDKVVDLKRAVATVASVPAAVQRLLLGASIVDDHDRLGDLCEPEATALDLTMVLTFEGHVSDLLNSSRPTKQFWALCDFLTIFYRSALSPGSCDQLESEARRALADSLGDDIAELMQLMARAAPAASSLEELGADFLSLLASYLRSQTNFIRSAAIIALPYVAPETMERAIATLNEHLGDADALVQVTTRSIYMQMAQNHKDFAVTALLARLEQQSDDNEALAILHLLPRLATLGDEVVTAALYPFLDTACPRARHEAVLALSTVSTHPKTMLYLAISLETDEDEAVRGAAAEALGTMAKWGSQEALFGLTSALGHPDENVRSLATRELPRAVREDDVPAIARVSDYLDHDDENVVSAALKVLSAVSHYPDALSLRLWQASLEHRNAAVRRRAYRGILSDIRFALGARH